ncbi:hypothetical protein F906_02873 [Acinetobacter pseudolwoffii]|uniref:Uncharacterized protein n=1 Tax=Acinetobacter pseudolwoffii TaxID=2053287 RepID=N9LWF0_9GAMM|nr:hypothetical protein F906_02873 [Acinetobacter pseudolwoffii]
MVKAKSEIINHVQAASKILPLARFRPLPPELLLRRTSSQAVRQYPLQDN